MDRRLAAEAATERPEEEEARARELALSRARRLAPSLAPEARRRRIAGFLARRGYPPDLCFRMAADAVSAGDDPPGISRSLDPLSGRALTWPGWVADV